MMVGEDFAEELVALFPDGAEGAGCRGWGGFGVADVEDDGRGTAPIWTEDLKGNLVTVEGVLE